MRVSARLVSRVAAVLLAAGALAVAGCAASPTTAGNDSSSEHATAAPTASPAQAAPWPADSGPVVAIEFEREGTPTTVTGEIQPGGLLSCAGGSVTIANKSPEAAVGVSFSVAGDDLVMGWVVGEDLVAQFSGSGSLESEVGEDGATTYTVLDAAGRASVQPRDPALTSIGDYDPSVAEQLEATTSFRVTCPAS